MTQQDGKEMSPTSKEMAPCQTLDLLAPYSRTSQSLEL